MSLCLTPDELIELTGYSQPVKQIGILNRNGTPYRIARNGKVRVLHADLKAVTAPRRSKATRVNLGALADYAKAQPRTP